LEAVLDLLSERFKTNSQSVRQEAEAPEEQLKLLFALHLQLIQPAVILWHLSDAEFDPRHQMEIAWPVFRRALRGYLKIDLPTAIPVRAEVSKYERTP
jgi:hypothetical protein